MIYNTHSVSGDGHYRCLPRCHAVECWAADVHDVWSDWTHNTDSSSPTTWTADTSMINTHDVLTDDTHTQSVHMWRLLLMRLTSLSICSRSNPPAHHRQTKHTLLHLNTHRAASGHTKLSQSSLTDIYKQYHITVPLPVLFFPLKWCHFM